MNAKGRCRDGVELVWSESSVRLPAALDEHGSSRIAFVHFHSWHDYTTVAVVARQAGELCCLMLPDRESIYGLMYNV